MAARAVRPQGAKIQYVLRASPPIKVFNAVISWVIVQVPHLASVWSLA